MLKLDNNLLQEIGLGALPEDQKRAMLQHIYDTLELRVGTQLANQMTDAQLEEFERFVDQGGDQNQAEALKWLESNLPNYKQVVQEVFESLKAEVRQMAPQIMASAASTTAGVQVPSQQYAAQPQMQSTYTTQPQPATPQQAYPQQYAQPTPQQPQPQDMNSQFTATPQPQPMQYQAPQQQYANPTPPSPPQPVPPTQATPPTTTTPFADPSWQPPQPSSQQPPQN